MYTFPRFILYSSLSPQFGEESTFINLFSEIYRRHNFLLAIKAFALRSTMTIRADYRVLLRSGIISGLRRGAGAALFMVMCGRYAGMDRRNHPRPAYNPSLDLTFSCIFSPDFFLLLRMALPTLLI